MKCCLLLCLVGLHIDAVAVVLLSVTLNHASDYWANGLTD